MFWVTSSVLHDAVFNKGGSDVPLPSRLAPTDVRRSRFSSRQHIVGLSSDARAFKPETSLFRVFHFQAKIGKESVTHEALRWRVN